jgi:hypothetical protein
MQASPVGFEPTISTVTGWRALRAALRGRMSVAQVGIEPTASLVLSQGGLPVAYRAMCLLCPEQESNLQTLGFKPSRSASWRIRALQIRVLVVPDGLEPPLPGCRPGVVAAGPRDCVCRSGSRGTRTHNGVTAPVFETGSSSGRMTSVFKLRGLESNQHQNVQSVPSYR